MKKPFQSAAALFALACAACHSEQTRGKVDNLVAGQGEDAGDNAVSNETTDDVAQPQ